MFLEGWPMSGSWRWRPIRVTANGQPALAFYAWDDDEQAYLPFALNVLTFRGRLISDVVAFVARTIDLPPAHSYARWVDDAIDPARLKASFERFGLPARLEEAAHMLADSKAFSGFAVPDIDAAREFYRDKLGLKVTERTGGPVAAHLASRG